MEKSGCGSHYEALHIANGCNMQGMHEALQDLHRNLVKNPSDLGDLEILVIPLSLNKSIEKLKIRTLSRTSSSRVRQYQAEPYIILLRLHSDQATTRFVNKIASHLDNHGSDCELCRKIGVANELSIAHSFNNSRDTICEEVTETMWQKTTLLTNLELLLSQVIATSAPNYQEWSVRCKNYVGFLKLFVAKVNFRRVNSVILATARVMLFSSNDDREAARLENILSTVTNSAEVVTKAAVETGPPVEQSTGGLADFYSKVRNFDNSADRGRFTSSERLRVILQLLSAVDIDNLNAAELVETSSLLDSYQAQYVIFGQTCSESLNLAIESLINNIKIQMRHTGFRSATFQASEPAVTLTPSLLSGAAVNSEFNFSASGNYRSRALGGGAIATEMVNRDFYESVGKGLNLTNTSGRGMLFDEPTSLLDHVAKATNGSTNDVQHTDVLSPNRLMPFTPMLSVDEHVNNIQNKQVFASSDLSNPIPTAGSTPLNNHRSRSTEIGMHLNGQSGNSGRRRTSSLSTVRQTSSQNTNTTSIGSIPDMVDVTKTSRHDLRHYAGRGLLEEAWNGGILDVSQNDSQIVRATQNESIQVAKGRPSSMQTLDVDNQVIRALVGESTPVRRTNSELNIRTRTPTEVPNDALNTSLQFVRREIPASTGGKLAKQKQLGAIPKVGTVVSRNPSEILVASRPPSGIVDSNIFES